MPRGKILLEYQRGQIDALPSQGLSTREIAAEIEKSQTVVQHYLADKKNYGTNKYRGGTPKLSDRDKRRICRESSNKSVSCNQIKGQLNLDITRQAIWKVLKSEENFQYMKMAKKQRLIEPNKSRRLEWAQEKVWWGRE